jgi:hypothetical protein
MHAYIACACNAHERAEVKQERKPAAYIEMNGGRETNALQRSLLAQAHNTTQHSTTQRNTS